jgi:[acyl-carrier-protein] S-malonyltransferase
MATAWAEQEPAAAAALDEAGDVLGFDVRGLMADGPEDELADTYNQQPAVLAASVAIVRAVSGRVEEPAFVAGHSLGEYSALVAATSLRYADALKLVRERGRLMGHAGDVSPGSMAAVLGLDDETVLAACAGVDGVQVANFNAPGQVVVSGSRDAVTRVSQSLKDAGAKRVVQLPITIAAHSELMRPVAAEFAEVVRSSPIEACAVPLVANVTASKISSADDVRDELSSQLTASVRWTDSVRTMLVAGVRDFYELGPGNVLTGLIKRIVKSEGVEDVRLHAMGEPGTVR